MTAQEKGRSPEARTAERVNPRVNGKLHDATAEPVTVEGHIDGSQEQPGVGLAADIARAALIGGAEWAAECVEFGCHDPADDEP